MDINVNDKTVIVFDLDDTLYNEFDFLKSAYTHIAKQLEPSDWKSLLVLMLSLYRSKKNVFDVLAERYNQSKDSLIEIYRNHTPDITLFPGALGILTAIKNRKGKIGILTDGRVKTQSAKINALGISDLVDKIVISEAIGSEKPDTRNFKIFEKDLQAETYCYIGDNLKKDFVAPNLLGWNTIGLVDNGLNIHYGAHQYFDQQYLPKQFILSIDEIVVS